MKRFLVVVFVLAAPVLLVEAAVQMGIAASKRPRPAAAQTPTGTAPAVNRPSNVKCEGPQCRVPQQPRQ